MQLVIAVVVIVFAVVGYFLWDRRYRGAQGDATLKPTGEVFKDPSSGKLTRVYEDPSTGKREYREEPEA
jgi:uncharacterized membrane protein YqiK